MTHDKYWLSKGSHSTPDQGRCALEWVSYIAGEPHSDSPKCVDPALRRLGIALNDRLPDTERQKLRPYLARMIGTATDGMHEQRVQMCREWLVKVILPDWLDAAGRHDLATQMRHMPDALVAENTSRLIYQARDEAYTAKREAMWWLEGKVRAKVGRPDAAAAVVAAADVAADADAAAAAAVDAAAAAAADAVAVAVAVADAAAAAAVAVAVAAAADVAVAVAAAAVPWRSTYDAVYTAVKSHAERVVKPIADRHNRMAFELLDRLLPTEVIRVPVVADAALVCGVAV